MHQAMQHSNLYALEGFGLTESSENAGASEAFATGEWFTVEREDGGEARIRLSGPRVQLERHLVPAQVEIKTGGEGEPEIYARVEVNEGGSKLAEICFVSTDPDARGIRQTDLREVEVSALLEDLVALFTIGYGLVPYTSVTSLPRCWSGWLRSTERISAPRPLRPSSITSRSRSAWPPSTSHAPARPAFCRRRAVERSKREHSEAPRQPRGYSATAAARRPLANRHPLPGPKRRT